MRLELARTLREYGVALVQSCDREKQECQRYEQGLEYMREARQVLTDCKAALDVQLVERDLVRYERVAELGKNQP
jgi:hypothetical protein